MNPYERLLAQKRNAEVYADYYAGRHPIAFDIDKDSSYARYFKAMLQSLRENLCPAVVDVFAERLQADRWDGIPDDEALERSMRRLMDEVHRAALLYGDAFVLVWPDMEPRPWAHDPRSMTVQMDSDDPHKVALAVQLWRLPDGRWRVNVYGDMLVMRLISPSKDLPQTLERYKEYDEDGADAVVEHTFGACPVVRFSNDYDTYTQSGRSVLADVVPLQNMLNKTLADMLIASEFHALPLRVLTGVQPVYDPTTGKSNIETFDPKNDRFMFFGGTDTRAFSLPAGDLKMIADMTDAIALKVARVTGCPLHYLLLGTGGFPSGEALRTAESRLIASVRDLQDAWTEPWQEVAALLGYDGAKPVWSDPARLTESERLERAAQKKALGLPQREVYVEMGYDEEQADALYAARQAETEAARQQYLKDFSAGL